MNLVDKQLYEDVYNWKTGDEPITREYNTMVKTLMGETQITAHRQKRTINPAGKYNIYF